MSDNTAIEWADASWTPIRVGPHRWYCEKISPGCDNCYASTFNRRMGGEPYPTVHDVRIGDVAPSLPTLDERVLDQVSTWRKPRRVFVCSMTDLFGEWVPFGAINRIFETMLATPHHQYLVLTKRPRRMLDFLEYRRDRLAEPPGSLGIPSWPQNVWAGVTIEEDRYSWRADLLRAVPAAVRWISAEPLLGPLDSLSLRGIHWLVVGGESGGSKERRLVRGCGPRREHLAHADTCPFFVPKPEAAIWVSKLQLQAEQMGTAFFFKQWGGPTPKAGGRLFMGRTWDEFPQPAGVPAAV